MKLSEDSESVDSANNHGIPTPSPRATITERESPRTSVDFRNDAPASYRAAEKITEVFSELTDTWNEYQKIDNGIRMTNALKDREIEEKLNAMKILELDEMLQIMRVELTRLQSVKHENEILSKQNRELAQRLDLAEGKISKIQKNVFVKMEESVKNILDDFCAREVELNRANNSLEAINKELNSKNLNFAEKLENTEDKVKKMEYHIEELRKKNEHLVKQNDELQNGNELLVLRNEKAEAEILELHENIADLNSKLLDTKKTEVDNALEAQNLKSKIVSLQNEFSQNARKHEQQVTNEMDAYRKELQKQFLEQMDKKNDTIECLRRNFADREATLEARNKALKSELEEKIAKVKHYEKNFEMIESQIKGNMRRAISANYKEVLNAISEGPGRIPSPPVYSNPLLELANEMEKENRKRESEKSNEKKDLVFIPKRNVSVQAGRNQTNEKRIPDVLLKRRPIKK